MQKVDTHSPALWDDKESIEWEKDVIIHPSEVSGPGGPIDLGLDLCISVICILCFVMFW
jgi:hypothetical protein